MPSARAPHVVILGGGFGGLYCARALKNTPVRITLVDRRNFHLFQPLLYQVATASLSPGDIAVPIRTVLRAQDNVEVWMGEATRVDPELRTVHLTDGALTYDYLVVATGATHSYFGRPEWEHVAPGLKTLEDATEIRRRFLLAFEAAEREDDPRVRRRLLTFVIVGAGPTGVELAGAMAEIARRSMPPDFRAIDTKTARVVLLEGADRVLPVYLPELSGKAEAKLRELGVEVRTRALVTDIDEESVRFGEEKIESSNVFWAAGVAASPLGATLGAELDRAGRVHVRQDCTIDGHPEVFVIGDLAHLEQDGRPLPGVAQTAMQMGRFVAETIRTDLKGQTRGRFRYTDKGNLATIGRAAAVAEISWFKGNGLLAWLIWVFVHIAYLIGFRNRIVVLVQWAWAYVSFSRTIRLITGDGVLHLRRARAAGVAPERGEPGEPGA